MSEFWGELRRPVTVLVYLLLALVVVELYHQAFYVFIQLWSILLIFLFAAVIAMLLTPLIDRVESLPPFRRRRALAVLSLFLFALLVLAVGTLLLAPTLIREVTTFGRQVPALQVQTQSIIDQGEQVLRGLGIDLRFTLPTGGGPIGGQLSAASIRTVSGFVSPVIDLLLVFVVSIYLTGEGRKLVATARNLFPKREHLFDFTVLAIGTAVSAYVRAQLFMSAILAVYTGITLSLLGVHYAIVLAILVFFLELVPLIGAPIGFVLAILVALTQSTTLALEVIGVSLLGHAIEAYILGPRISAHVNRIHPLVALGALLIGAQLAGILGALFAVPTAVIANILLGAVYASRKGEQPISAITSAGPVALADLPTLGDQISVSNEEVEVRIESNPMSVSVTKRRTRPAREAPKPALARAGAKRPREDAGA